MKKDRYSQIIEIMERQNTISIRELAEKLNCTEMTIRRNLDKLQEMNFVKRERGYAVLLKPAQPTDYYVQNIRPYQTICIDSGTTTQLLVETLPENIHLSVITTSLTASMTLSNNENIQVLIPTGFLHHKNRSVILADPDIMKQYQADVAFLSCRAFRVPGGAFEHSQSLTSTKKALASIAQKRILLLDYSKWGINSLCNSFPLEQIDIIITDNKAPKDSVSKIVKLGKEIIIVNPETKSIENHYNPSNPN